MEERNCLICSESSLKIIQVEDNKLYGYTWWKLKCVNCGERFDEDRYTFDTYFI